jgi:6-phosphogluconolactonase
MEEQIRLFESEAELEAAVAAAFRALAEATVRDGRRFTVALTGGEDVRSIYARLAREPRLPWDRTEVFWGDERAVPPDDARSNFALARDSLLSKVGVHPGLIHRIEGERGAAEAAHAYARELERVFGADDPVFDLVYLGLGTDGHIAALFPGQDDVLRSRAGLISTFPSPGMDPQVGRITMGLSLLNRAREVHFLVPEGDRAEALHRILEANEDLPARRIQGPRVSWFIGPEAGRLLSRGKPAPPRAPAQLRPSAD